MLFVVAVVLSVWASMNLTGFLGRFLALEWLERLALVDGKLICVVGTKDDAAAGARPDKTFDSGDPELLAL
jgi:fatty acid CoA ligase FadD9